MIPSSSSPSIPPVMETDDNLWKTICLVTQIESLELRVKLLVLLNRHREGDEKQRGEVVSPMDHTFAKPKA